MPDQVRPRIALALQGGGAYGAYGWGVIDRLLDENVEIVSVSGASAGAVNAVALVSGLATGGNDGARHTLSELWRDVSRCSPLGALQMLDWTHGMFAPFVEPVVRKMLESAKLLSSVTAPWVPQSVRSMQALRAVVGRHVDMSLFADGKTIPIYVSATDMRTGLARIFSGGEISLDAVMASACLPDLFDPVVIGGQHYWDGGYSANPPLDPLLHSRRCPTDMLIVQLTPFTTETVAGNVVETMSRVNDISFSACLQRDLDSLMRLQRSVRSGGVIDPEWRRVAAVNLHLLAAADDLGGRGPTAKSDTRWSTLEELHDLGYRTADTWLETHREDLGHASTLRFEEDEQKAA
jgi:NTE family protein